MEGTLSSINEDDFPFKKVFTANSSRIYLLPSGILSINGSKPQSSSTFKQLSNCSSFFITDGIRKKLTFRPFLCLLLHETIQHSVGMIFRFDRYFGVSSALLKTTSGLPSWPLMRLQCIVVQIAKGSIDRTLNDVICQIVRNGFW